MDEIYENSQVESMAASIREVICYPTQSPISEITDNTWDELYGN
jgi:hypothetical protein